jgi:hypothetical protein
MELKWKESGVDIVNLVLADAIVSDAVDTRICIRPCGGVERVGERDPDWYCGGRCAHKIHRVGGMGQPRARTVGRGLAMGSWLRHANSANMGPGCRWAGRRGVGRGEAVALASRSAAGNCSTISLRAGPVPARASRLVTEMARRIFPAASKNRNSRTLSLRYVRSTLKESPCWPV